MNLNFSILYLLLLISFLIAFVLIMISFLIGIKTPDKEKVSVYECGFNPFHSPGEPFSIRFFLVAILFLVFDLEISYLFPWSVASNLINLKGQAIIILFLLILILGLIYEWVRGGLEWA